MRSQKKAAPQPSDADESDESVTTRSFSQRNLSPVLIANIPLTLFVWIFITYATRNSISAGSVALQILCWPKLQNA